jgi:RNA polymerase primary sigma factor
MSAPWQVGDFDGFSAPDGTATQVLDVQEERRLLRELAACKRELAEARADVAVAAAPRGADEPQSLARSIAPCCGDDGSAQARLRNVSRSYSELRSRLALANLRLVAHVAKRFRDRGIAYSDLLQEGFCGLLEAIDRFDLAHGTKLGTYATWWIRQSLQQAVAAGAYAVRLSPRHLFQLTQDQRGVGNQAEGAGDQSSGPGGPSAALIRQIRAATRPAVSLDANLDGESDLSLLQTMSEPEVDRLGMLDRDAAIGNLMESLHPRERRVLALRFGLSGQPRLSLSQVGQVLAVSKERVRQIEQRALTKLRATADERGLTDRLAVAS